MANSAEDNLPEGLCRAGRWLSVIAFFVVLCSPKPDGLTLEAWRLVAVTAVMAVLWFTQGLPIAVTGLIPLVFYPLMSIRSADLVAKSYIESNIWLSLGGFIIALGIERWGLHRRMALHILCWLGTSPRGLVLGFMLGTGFVSMWISNTAATLMMLPIGVALLKTLEEIAGIKSTAVAVPILAADPGSKPATYEPQEMNLLGSEDSRPTMPSAAALLPNTMPWLPALSVPLVLGIAYSASIGGVATPVGTPTNVAFLGIWAKQFPDAPRISSGAWIISFTPLAVLMLFASWLVLTWHLPWRTQKHWMNSSFFRRRLEKIGPPKRGEIVMFIIFVSTALLWVLRPEFKLGAEPLFIGWTKWLELTLPKLGWTGFKASFVDDATVSIGMCLLMFFIPIERDAEGRTSFLMDWPTAERLPWGLILLFGGGFAVADAFRATQLEQWVGQSIATLVSWRSPLIWVIIVATCLTFLSEFTSNVATANMFLPILAGVSVSLGIDPRMLMLPATIATSFSFMLPAGTPPNAIVFGTGRVRIDQMVKYGFILNCMGIILVTLVATLWMVPRMGIVPNELPEWAVTKQP
ncbi:MAG: anion transporter [Planctomycetaceae bacterium]|nr:anion transporter [Planctomycetaceae bacterium]